MKTDRDSKGRFAKGNVAGRSVKTKVKEGDFLSARARNKIEGELEQWRERLEAQVGGGPREKMLVGQVISLHRTVVYINRHIRKLRVFDMDLIGLLVRTVESERKILELLKTESPRRFKTPLEKAAEFEAEKARKSGHGPS